MSDYSPTYADVCVARAMLGALGLPTELVLEILEYAQYEIILDFVSPSSHSASAKVHQQGRCAMSAQLCLDAPILTQKTVRALQAKSVKPKIKKVEFQFSSRDQGWVSERSIQGSYNTSSWVEVSILRPTSSSDPEVSVPKWDFDTPQSLQVHMNDRGHTLVTRPTGEDYGPQAGEEHLAWYLQGNRVAAHTPDEYRTIWGRGYSYNDNPGGSGAGEGFVEALQEGDRLLVWARAKYPGWQCIVENVTVTVHYDFE